MAQVDFSNAVLDVKSGEKPLDSGSILGFNQNSWLLDESGNVITTNHINQILSKSDTKITILYTGQFTTNGTVCCPGTLLWKISNITFAAGDIYSFAIDIETSITS